MNRDPESTEEQDENQAEVPEELVVPESSDKPEQIDEMAEALAEAMPIVINVGDIVTGVVAAAGPEGLTVDIGSKYEGIVPASEFSDVDELPAVDDEIEVAVVKIDEKNSIVRLSKRRADYERVWNELVEAAETGKIVEAVVTERVKGGLRVDVGVPGFVPGSQVATKNPRSMDRFVGQSIRLRILEADRKSKKVILSHRQVVDEERKARRDETLEGLHEGMVCEGKVRSLTDYGAFIDLGGVDGLLHVSEMAWTRVKHPSDILKVGDAVKVAVLDIDPDSERISLSRRQILPDPWKEAAKKVRVGEVLKARVTRVARTGAFAQLPEYDIEGFIPIGEMSHKRINDPSEVVEKGMELELKVIDVKVNARRMTLSVIAAQEERERAELQKYLNKQETTKVTLGDAFGAILQQAAGDIENAEENENSEQ